MPALRTNDSALGPLERPALAWLAARMPDCVCPDHLTVLALAGAALAAAGYIASRWSLEWLWLASIGLVVHWAGDSLDGTLARIRDIQRPRYGFFVDHTSDLFAQTLIFLALGLSPCARFEIACLGLIAFLMAFVYSLICVEVHDTMRVTYFGFGPTEIRALLIAGNTLSVLAGIIDFGPLLTPHGELGPLTIYEAVILIFFALAVPALAVVALRERGHLARRDPAKVAPADCAAVPEP